MIIQMSLWFFTVISIATACQPTPTTTQQQVRTFVADSPINVPHLINVEPSRIPVAPEAPVQTIFDILKLPLPPSIQVETTTEESDIEFESNSTSKLKATSIFNSTEEVDSSGLSGVLNGTDSSNNLIKDLANAEKSVLSTFSELESKVEPTITTRSPLKLFAAPISDDGSSTKCSYATITAITIMPYDDRLVGIDLDKLHQQVSLLEAYTQRKLSSFGEFSEEVTNLDGKFALRYNIKSVTNCTELRNFATKAVSYSREIERIQYSCMCQPIWIIAKRKSPQNNNF